MARKQQIRGEGDLREYPRYSIEEASRYLKIPLSTMKSWVRGYTRTDKYGLRQHHDAALRIADPERGLLSFLNLAEAYVLRFARKERVSLKQLRLAVEYISKLHPGPHPLLEKSLRTSLGSVFIRELGIPLNASRHGQFGIKEVLSRHLAGIKWGADGIPEELTPMQGKIVSINPFYSSGEPIVTGTGIMVSVLVSRTRAGENPEEIASDYGLDRKTLEQAVRAFRRPQAA